MSGAVEPKTILIIITYLLAYAIDPAIVAISFNEYLKPKVKNRFLNFLLCFGIEYILVCIKQEMFLLGDANIGSILAPLILIYILLLALVAYEGTLKRKFLIVILNYSLTFIVEAFYSVILMLIDFEFNNQMKFSWVSASVTLLIRTTDIIIFLSFKNFLELIKKKDAKPYMVFCYLIIFVCSGFAMNWYESTDNNKIIFGLYCTQAIVMIALFGYIFVIIKNTINREHEAIKRAELSESKIAFLDYSREIYEEIKLIRHDMKKHYNYLLDLNRRKDYEAIERYLTELCNDLHETETLYPCENLILAVALSDAQKKAKQQDIDFNKIVTIYEFPFTDTELNSVITNILDNAFEAVSKVQEGERAIKLEIKQINEEEIMICCENTYEAKEYAGKAFLTTVKPDKDNHGYGTKIVRKIVKRYKGTVVYWKDKNKFYVKIIVRG